MNIDCETLHKNANTIRNKGENRVKYEIAEKLDKRIKNIV